MLFFICSCTTASYVYLCNEYLLQVWMSQCRLWPTIIASRHHDVEFIADTLYRLDLYKLYVLFYCGAHNSNLSVIVCGLELLYYFERIATRKQIRLSHMFNKLTYLLTYLLTSHITNCVNCSWLVDSEVCFSVILPGTSN